MKLINRITSPTPPFFKKLRTISLTITGLATALLSVSGQVEMLADYKDMLILIIAVGGALAGTAQTAKDDK